MSASGKVVEMLKKPAVLAVGVALGLLFLYANRNGGGSAGGGVDATLRSQEISTGANVALSAQTRDFNIAALQYQTALATKGAAMYNADVNAATAIDLHALASLDNLNTLTFNNARQRDAIAGGIKINTANIEGMLSAARIAADTKIALAPGDRALVENLARINGADSVALANVNATTATAIAQINASTRTYIATTEADARRYDADARRQMAESASDSASDAGLFKLAGTAIGAYFGGPAGAAVGGQVGGAIST